MENQSEKSREERTEEWIASFQNNKKNSHPLKKDVGLKLKPSIYIGVAFMILISAIVFFISNKENDNTAFKASENNQSPLVKEEDVSKKDLTELSEINKIEKEDENNEYNEDDENESDNLIADMEKDAEEKAKKETEEEEKEAKAEAKKEKEQLAIKKDAEDAKKKETEDAEKKERQAKVSSINAKLSEAKNEIAGEMSDLSTEMENLRQKIYSIEHQNENAMSTGASQAMIDKQSAPYDSALKSAQSEYSSLANTKNKIGSLSGVLSSYSNYNTPLSSSDISFLSSLGITF